MCSTLLVGFREELVARAFDSISFGLDSVE